MSDVMTAVRETATSRFGDRVRCTTPFGERPLLWIEPTDPVLKSDATEAAAWFAEHREAVEQALIEHGAIFLRGFPVRKTEDFGELLDGFDSFAPGYFAGTTDRKAVKGRVMEATRTADDFYILLHQEMAYLPTHPRVVAFYCHKPAPQGGETIIGDMRGLLEELPDYVAEKLRAVGVRYARNLRPDDPNDWRADPKYRHLSWQYHLESDDKDEIGRRLTERGANYEWHDDGSLSIYNDLPGVTTHPETGEEIFFNQIHIQSQHRFVIGERALEMDRAYGTKWARPYSTAYGDGERISDEHLAALMEALERRVIRFGWEAGDVMLVENKLTAHGRKPYSGDRDVQVMLLD